MSLVIHKQFFKERNEVLEDMKITGHWPTTFVSDPSPEMALHWHDLDVTGYIMSGSTYMLDERGERHVLEPGDKFEIPRGTLHAEGEVIEATTYIVGTEVAGKVFEQFAPLDADDPNRPK